MSSDANNSALSRFRTRLSTLSPLDKLARSTAAQAAPSPTLSYYHHHVPPTPATFVPLTRGKGQREDATPPVPAFPFGRDRGPSSEYLDSPLGSSWSPKSADCSPSRRKPKPAPLVLTPPRQRVPGVPIVGDGIHIVTTLPSPTSSASPSPSDALSFRTRKRREGSITNVAPMPVTCAARIGQPPRAAGTLPPPPFPFNKTLKAEDENSEYATVEPGYQLPSWMHGTDANLSNPTDAVTASKHTRIIDFLRIGGGSRAGSLSAGPSCSNYTGYEEDFRDGDVFADGVLGLRHKPSIATSLDPESDKGFFPSEEHDGRVSRPAGGPLHNILLTPTYEKSPISPGGGLSGEGRRRLINPLAKSPTPFGRGERRAGTDERQARRGTLLDRAANLLAQKRMNFVDSRIPSYDDDRGVRSGWSTGAGVGFPPGRGGGPSSKKRREAVEMGTLFESTPGYGSGRGSEGGSLDHEDGNSEKRGILLKCFRWRNGKGGKFKQVHIVMVVSAVVIALLVISICTALLTKNKAAPTSMTSTSTSTSTSSATATQGEITASPSASATSSAYTIDSCLDLFASSAPTAPTTFPCDSCVPLLQGTTNDFLSSSTGTISNGTGVGATLQFCALQTLFAATGSATATTTAPSSGSTSTASSTTVHARRSFRMDKRATVSSPLTGWMENASPCTSWSGVTCDAGGRVTTLAMAYPAVPSTLSSSISDLIALTSLKIIGNSVIPSGPFPDEILGLSELVSLDIESTAMTGSLSADAFDTAAKLQTLALVSNAKLGTQLPSFYGAGAIQTITITGQALTAVPEDMPTSTLTYLDLSYNSLGGAIPDTSGYSSLTTLFLEGNSFSSLPAGFAPNLTSLSLQGNPELAGTLPPSLCASTVLQSCTLSNTVLGTSNEVNKTAISFVSATTVVGSSTIAAYAAVTSVSTSKAVCGACTF